MTNTNSHTTIIDIELPRVLLVDDEPKIIAALQREFMNELLTITSFTDSRLALDLSLKQEFAVIISDNRMPELSGLDLFAEVKIKCPATRRVLLTGRTEIEEGLEAFNEGIIHRYIDKPWIKEELLAIVANEVELYLKHQEETLTVSILEEEIKKRDSQIQKLLKKRDALL